MISAEKSVYISYSWGAEKKYPLVDELLAAGRAILLVLSEEYFKSPNCMYELREIYLNSRKEFRMRIFPVVLQGTKFHKSIDRIPYIRFWEEETDNLNTAHDSVSKTNISTASHQELRDYASFAYMISDLQALIGDMNHQEATGVKKPCQAYFNPRPREGGDSYADEFSCCYCVFQSTPP